MHFITRKELIESLKIKGYSALTSVMTYQQLVIKDSLVANGYWSEVNEDVSKDIEKRNLQNVRFLESELAKLKSMQSIYEKKLIADILKHTKWIHGITAKGKRFYLDKSKLEMRGESLRTEVKNISILVDLGFQVFLPKEDHSNANEKNADAIINGVWVELKYLSGNIETVGRVYRQGLHQSPNVSLFISKGVPIESNDDIFKRTNTSARASSQRKGILITYFDKTSEFFADSMLRYNKN